MNTDSYDKLASIFIEAHIDLIDTNNFVELFIQAEKSHQKVGTIKALRKLLDDANIEYKEILETTLYEYVEYALQLLEQEGKESISIIDFEEFYLKHTLGYELHMLIDFLKNFSTQLNIDIRIETVDGYTVPVLIKQ